MKTEHKLVTILIVTQGYEKFVDYLITYIPEDYKALAFDYACVLEAHNDLEDTSEGFNDGGDFFYLLDREQTISPEDLKTLSKYLNTWEFCPYSANSLEIQ